MKTACNGAEKQRGMSVLVAILIAATVAALAFALSARERLWLNQTANHQDLAAAQTIALGAIDLARLTLRDDMRRSEQDHLLEMWTTPIPPVNVEEGRVSGRLVELQGRFNLFNLQDIGRINPSRVAALERLLVMHGLPVDWAKRMADAIAVQTAAAGASRGNLLPVANLQELAELSGIDAVALASIEPLLCILPQNTPINVNFAPPEILSVLTPGLSISEAERIVSRRASVYFKTTKDYLNVLPERLRSSEAGSFTVESQYFLSEIDASYGRANVRLRALIFRQRGRMPELIWVRRA